jgi:hypothetical protein
MTPHPAALCIAFIVRVTDSPKRKKRTCFLFILMMGLICHRDGSKSRDVLNTLLDLRSTVELRGSAALEMFFQSWSSAKHAHNKAHMILPFLLSSLVQMH